MLVHEVFIFRQKATEYFWVINVNEMLIETLSDGLHYFYRYKLSQDIGIST